MRLAEFISQNMEPILREWDAFAKTLYPSSQEMTARALRDHAEQILNAIVADLGNSQTKLEQSEKSKGRAPVVTGTPETAAQTHAILRAQSGIDINQLASEYRALRASITRLWVESEQVNNENSEDMIRFNEAIDQALAESIAFFNENVVQSRNLLLGMLGHDLRNPLNAVLLTASELSSLNAGEDVSAAAATLIRSGAAMKSLLDDLVEYNRVNLGVGINIVPRETSLAAIFDDELRQLRLANPQASIDLKLEGEVRGIWDGPRLQQVLRNLVSNAITYGAAGAPIRVRVQEEDAEVHIEVANTGSPIEPADMERIFDPLRRGEAEKSNSNNYGLGLGLYIVREIVRAHGGKVVPRSDPEETVFSIRLPRKCASAGARIA